MYIHLQDINICNIITQIWAYKSTWRSCSHFCVWEWETFANWIYGSRRRGVNRQTLLVTGYVSNDNEISCKVNVNLDLKQPRHTAMRGISNAKRKKANFVIYKNKNERVQIKRFRLDLLRSENLDMLRYGNLFILSTPVFDKNWWHFYSVRRDVNPRAFNLKYARPSEDGPRHRMHNIKTPI